MFVAVSRFHPSLIFVAYPSGAAYDTVLIGQVSKLARKYYTRTEGTESDKLTNLLHTESITAVNVLQYRPLTSN